MKQLIDINDLIEFLDKKVFKLRRQLEISREAFLNTEDCAEIENEIAVWKKKRIELSDLQAKIMDTHIKELTSAQ